MGRQGMLVDGGRTPLQILKARPVEQGLEGEGCGIWEREENGDAGSEAGEGGERWQGELFVIQGWPALQCQARQPVWLSPMAGAEGLTKWQPS